MARLFVCVAMAVVWWLAAAAWPELPERMPVHFDLEGRPDAWVAKSAPSWFLPPALATALGLLLAFGLPAWVGRLARRNSPWLNVPDRAAFRALPEESRVRAAVPPLGWLAAPGVALQLLFAWFVHASAQIAHGAWRELPTGPTWLLLALVMCTACALALASARSVRREVARAAA